jgi:GH15 family glucan-1,4-alpha-glucosidase
MRSLITLKALTYAPTGGIVAAPTTSLPEQLGGVRNWDYRYCWVRDATFTLYALISSGYIGEAKAWREWLLRAVAGTPSQLNIMYGLAGERRLSELELEWLPGYEGAAPVRIGNAAYQQFQLDVYGEMMDLLYVAARLGLKPDDDAWRLQRALLDFLASAWRQPDEGIWEMRGPKRHFTHSKVMAWVAVDRAIKAVEHFGVEGPVERWRQLRDIIHAEVCQRGFDAERNTFVQYYEGKALDASLLMIPLVGFLPPSDARVRGTVEAITRHLMTDGFVARYPTTPEVDGLPAGEGAFLACTFWLADALALLDVATKHASSLSGSSGAPLNQPAWQGIPRQHRTWPQIPRSRGSVWQRGLGAIIETPTTRKNMLVSCAARQGRRQRRPRKLSISNDAHSTLLRHP